MRNRSIVLVMSLAVFAMYLGFGSVRMNDKISLEEKEEAKLLASIEYIEERKDDEFDLGFNVYEYLPLDFDPYRGMIYNLDDIEYIELEELEL